MALGNTFNDNHIEDKKSTMILIFPPLSGVFGSPGLKIRSVALNVSMPIRKIKHKLIIKLTA